MTSAHHTDPSVFTTDPSAGLQPQMNPAHRETCSDCTCTHHDSGGSTPARSGQQSTAQGPAALSAKAATTGGVVRPAHADDLESIGAIHSRVMCASLTRAHETAHAGTPLPEGVLAMMSPVVLATGWEQAVTHPPSPAHHVLVATDGEDVVGLIALAPTSGRAVTEDGSPAGTSNAQTPAAEIIALGVDPQYQRRGHGSRLLAAATDLARADGADIVLMWAVRGDNSLAGLLQSAGCQRTPSHRQLPVGQGVVEDCWAASLSL